MTAAVIVTLEERFVPASEIVADSLPIAGDGLAIAWSCGPSSSSTIGIFCAFGNILDDGSDPECPAQHAKRGPK